MRVVKLQFVFSQKNNSNIHILFSIILGVVLACRTWYCPSLIYCWCSISRGVLLWFVAAVESGYITVPQFWFSTAGVYKSRLVQHRCWTVQVKRDWATVLRGTHLHLGMLWLPQNFAHPCNCDWSMWFSLDILQWLSSLWSTSLCLRLGMEFR